MFLEMNKKAEEKIEKLKSMRMDLLTEVQNFPKEHRVRKLFGDWNLKDILVHITAWDMYVAGSIEDFINDIEIYEDVICYCNNGRHIRYAELIETIWTNPNKRS